MSALIKKELRLCIHPTVFLFFTFSALVFVPNYPYEVIFFFSALSAYFCCISARENGDLAFTGALPVKKTHIPLARILVTVGMQCIMLALTGILGAVKSAALPAEQQINQAGLSANLALVGNGAVILGVFNLLFFPLLYRSPERVGVPFLLAAAAQFLLVGLFLLLRWCTPLFSVALNGSNAEHTAAKVAALFIGLAAYAAMTALSCFLSMRNFKRVDL